MNKILAIILIVAILGIGGYFYLNSKSSKAPTIQPTTQNAPSNVFTSIKDAISKSIPLKCEYDNQGKKTITYIKGDQISTTYDIDATKKGHALVLGKTTYIWEDGKTQGTKITITEEQIKQGQEMAKNYKNTPPQQKEDTVAKLEQYKQSCKQEVVPNSVFEVPSDIKFVDLNEQMKKSGIDMEKMMKQYQTTPTAQ